MKSFPSFFMPWIVSIGLAGCAAQGAQLALPREVDSVRVSNHRDNDDLITAGLGADGLRAAVPPAFADPAQPKPAELRRRASSEERRVGEECVSTGRFGGWPSH